MSYNGIGLKSAKGSSTSGHIQKSLANNEEKIYLLNYKARKQQQQQQQKVRRSGDGHVKKLSQLKTVKNGHLLNKIHDSMVRRLSKREIELRVSELRDQLEDDRDNNNNNNNNSQGKLTDSDIDRKCNDFREELIRSEIERVQLSKRYKSRKDRLSQEEDATNPDDV